MKKLLLLFTFISYQISIGQCTVQGTNFGNNTVSSYEVTGDVTLTLNTDNTLKLDLGSNFQTAAGPDVRVYIVNSNGLSVNALKNSKIADLENIEFGLVSCSGCNPVIPEDGAKSFVKTIPSDVDITNFDKLFFYCKAFDAFWDFGDFTPFSSSNCSVLNINDAQQNEFSIYPNPAKNSIKIFSQHREKAEIKIHNVLGKKVFQTKIVLNQDLNISNLKTGLYILSVKTGEKISSKKLVIK